MDCANKIGSVLTGKGREVKMIQIDMPMPTNCLDCPACNEYLMCAIPVNGRKWGENGVSEFGQSRPEWCPLKEREAVEPTLIREGQSKYYNDYVCPYCDNEVVYEQNYCSECGAQFMWERE